MFRQQSETLTWFIKTGLKKAEGRSVDGVMHHEWHSWRETGELWQAGQFRDAVKHGPWVRHTRDGSFERAEPFEGGRAVNGWSR